MKKLVLFDCDGTLVDSQQMIVGSMNGAFAALGRTPPTRSETLSIVGLSLPIAIRALVGTDDPDIAALVEAYKTSFHRLRADPSFSEPMFPGALATLDALAARGDVVIGMATGKSRRGVNIVVAHHKLEKHFATLQCADDAPSKPDPGMVLNACAETGIAPEDTVVVGDTVFDLMMAKAAGAAGIGVDWGYHPREKLLAAQPLALISAFDALMGVLDAHWAAPRPVIRHV